MLRNYLTVAWRNLLRQRTYALLNVTGLAVGVAFSLLALLYVHHQWSFDRFHESAERIHLIRYDYQWPGSDDLPMVCTPPVLAPTLTEEMPELGPVVRVYWGDMTNGVPVAPEAGEPLWARGVFVDPGFFSIFSFPELAGDSRQALADPQGVVLSRDLARRCYGEVLPIGRQFVVTMAGIHRSFEVRGVVEVPTSSSLTFDFAISHAVRGQLSDQWGHCHVLTFVELSPGVDRLAGEEALARIASRHLSPEMQRRWGGEAGIKLRLLPLLEMHFTQGLREIPAVLNPLYCWAVAGIAIGVLIIACVNFVNLSLALMSRRTREVGVRKTAGASRGELARQFLAESTLVTLVSVAAGVALAELLLPSFGGLLGVDLRWRLAPTLIGAGSLIVIIALATGLYPALLLSRLDPVRIMRGRLGFGGTSPLTRALVAVQFACAALFAITALVMSGQVEHLREQGLGFDSDQVMVIDVERGQPERSVVPYESLIAALRHAAAVRPEIIAVGAANNRFASNRYEGTILQIGDRPRQVGIFFIDEGFLAALGIGIKEGRSIAWDRQAEISDAMLVNETMASLLGPGTAVGQSFTDPRATQRQRTIVGVVGDVQLSPMGQEAIPIIFQPPEHARYLENVYVRLAPGHLREALQQVQAVWEQVFPGRPLPYSFLDDDVAEALRQDGRWVPVTRAAAGVGIAIAALGLLGLTALAVERRTKEIGIRKVVGAPVTRIVWLLSREYTGLVLAANAGVWPVAALVCTRWLEQFADRIDLSWTPFLAVALGALLVAWVTVSWQTIRAALADPVKALRYE
ncbi:MAG: ABC transporter permease [Candidatus Latescibacterota bacterium]|jgi:putative ABC transport system permease protein